MNRAGSWGLLAALLVTAPAAADPYEPTRADYTEFAARHPGLLEPNYLPFMAYRIFVPAAAVSLPRWLGGKPSKELLVLCRWQLEGEPLRVSIEAPEQLPDDDALRPADPREFVAAVEAALARWARDLDGAIAFERVDDPARAALHVRMVGERAPVADPEIEVLGSARAGSACRATGPLVGDRVPVRFAVPELTLYLADQHGLLLPDQVERVALHEIGHALGMPHHSPVPADLMFPVAPDRLARDGLGAQDVNSFLALYSLPNGTVLRDPSLPPERGVRAPGAPRLGLAPYVDARLGFEVQPPAGWTRIPSPYGFVAVDGTSWDFEASFQLVVRRFASIQEYLERHGAQHFASGVVRRVSEVRVDGHRAKYVVKDTQRATVEELWFIESGDGRLLIGIAESPTALHEAFSPWFAAVIGSLEIRSVGRAGDRLYRER